MTIEEFARKLRGREITARELTEECLRRITELHRALRPVGTTTTKPCALDLTRTRMSPGRTHCTVPRQISLHRPGKDRLHRPAKLNLTDPRRVTVSASRAP